MKKNVMAVGLATLALAACAGNANQGWSSRAGTDAYKSAMGPIQYSDIVRRSRCPVTLEFVRPYLVTSPQGFEEMKMTEAVDRQLSRNIDSMIARGGGFDQSIQSGQKYVSTYKEMLANEDKIRAEYRGYGKSDQWIDLYLSTLRDGVTINEAFVEAVRCRRPLSDEGHNRG